MPDKETFKRYLVVQHLGWYNMWSRQAQEMVNCTTEEYLYIISHYAELVKKYNISCTDKEIRDAVENLSVKF